MAVTEPAPTVASVETRPVAAACLMLLATVCYASMTLIARHLSGQVHAFEVLFFRNAFGLVIMLPWLLRLVQPGMLKAGRIGMHGLRAGFNSVSLGCWFLAVGMMPLADATAITFTAPLWVTIFAALFLGETVRARRWSATVVGFVGVLIILRPGAADSGFDILTPGALLALGAAASWAMTVIALRSLSRSEAPEAVMTWQVLLMAPISLPAAAFFWTMPNLQELLWMGLLAAMATAGQLCHINALRLQDITALQPIDFVKLPIIATLAFFLYAEVPTVWTFVGGVVVFVAASYVSWREARIKRGRAVAVPIVVNASAERP